MNFLLILIIILISDVGVIWYLTDAEFFRPFSESGEVHFTNVVVVLFLISILAGTVVSLLVFLGEKFIYCGRREFPRPTRAIKFGLIVFLCCILLLILHVFQFLNFWIALVLVIFVIIMSVIFT